MSKRIKNSIKRSLSAVSKKLQQRHMELEQKPHDRGLLRQIVLGGQDGLVNVLGILLGMASGTGNSSLVILAGLAATLAESVSMAAVAYTSARAEQDHYQSQLKQELYEIKEIPDVERKEVELIYYKKGFRGKALQAIVKKICSDEKLWLETMMREELGLYESEHVNPLREATIVGFSSVIGSLLPLIPFFFMPVNSAIIASLALSLGVLFFAGAFKARITTGVWWKSGLEMAIIGGSAALLGYLVGLLLGASASIS